MHETGLIVMLAAGFGLAFVFGLIAFKLRLPALVGYLLAGVAVGPFTPGFVGDPEIAGQLAEVGVILLMFGVGLHFSLADLLAVRRISLPGAIAQIVAATAMGAFLTQLWGASLGEGLIFGLALSVASTVVLLRALEERGVLDSADGRIAVGWLIVEDLAMVLALVLLPVIAGSVGGVQPEGVGERGIVTAIAITLAKVAAFLAVMFTFGRKLIPGLLAMVARTKSRELFTLGVLAIAVGLAVGAAELFGVSFALGAFFAGVVISESDLSHQAAADALPFQDAFAVLFFVSVGMLFDPSILTRSPLQVLTVLFIIVAGKSVIAAAIVLLFRYPLRTALIVAASLAQIGEFSFILAGLGVTLGLMSTEAHSLILAGALLSIVLNPLTFRIIDPIEGWVRRRPRLAALFERPAGALSELPMGRSAEDLVDHVVIVGYGRVGQPIGEMLQAQGIPYVVIEQNREAVERLREKDLPVIYGDASRPLILEHAHIERARLLICAAPDPIQARFVLQHAKAVNPDIDVVVRTHSDEERSFLEERGAGRAVVAEREIALAMVRYAFGTYGIQQDMSGVAARTLRLRDPHSGRNPL